VSDFYSLETDDIQIVQGDTVNIGYEFVDDNDAPIDITGYECIFSVTDPLTRAELLSIPCFTILTNPSIAANNQIIVALSSSFTESLDYGIAYPFKIKLQIGDPISKVITAICGHLIINKG